MLAEGFAAGLEMERELKDYVKARLAVYKYPRWVEFKDELPKNERGKMDRRALKQ